MSSLKRWLPACCIMLFMLMLPNVILAAPASSPARSTTRPIQVNINGAFISADSSPFIQSGRTMIPIRTLASLGLQYSWDATRHMVTITNSSNDLFEMTQGQSNAYKNGQPVQMDSEANNYNGRIMVPAKFVSEAFGYSVYYEKIRRSSSFNPRISLLMPRPSIQQILSRPAWQPFRCRCATLLNPVQEYKVINPITTRMPLPQRTPPVMPTAMEK